MCHTIADRDTLTVKDDNIYTNGQGEQFAGTKFSKQDTEHKIQ